MNRTEARTLMEEVLGLLNSHFEDRGIKVTKGNGKYDDTSLTVPITFNEPNEEGVVQTQEEKDYELLAGSFGLYGVPLGTTFIFKGDTYTISGLKPRSRKYPVLAKQVANGKTYKFPADHVRLYVEKGA